MILEGKKINFLGDSITEGHGTTNPAETTFHQLIRKTHNLSGAYNCGIGGTRIARTPVPTYGCIRHDLDFPLRAQRMPLDVDAVVVFGGTNDYGHGKSNLGTPDSHNPFEFYGGLNLLCEQLLRDYPEKPIIFMTPIHRTNENNAINGYILEDFVNAIRDVTAKYNFPLIDLFADLDLDPYNTTLVPDGLHPSDAGHAVMAEFIGKKLLEL